MYHHAYINSQLSYIMLHHAPARIVQGVSGVVGVYA